MGQIPISQPAAVFASDLLCQLISCQPMSVLIRSRATCFPGRKWFLPVLVREDLTLFGTLPWGPHHGGQILVITLLRGVGSSRCSGLSPLKTSGYTVKTPMPRIARYIIEPHLSYCSVAALSKATYGRKGWCTWGYNPSQ